MKTVYFIVLAYLNITLLAAQHPTFTQEEILRIAQKNPLNANRIRDYIYTVAHLQNETTTKQLNKTNLYLNGLLGQYDSIINHQENYWETPKEFLQKGYGDCEDYVIIKYYTLIKLHFPKEKLFLTIVKEKYYGGYHMVLAYFDNTTHDPLILDNLSFKILRLSQRTDLDAQLFINTTGVYSFDNKQHLHKISNTYKKFEELQSKVSKNL